MRILLFLMVACCLVSLSCSNGRRSPIFVGTPVAHNVVTERHCWRALRIQLEWKRGTEADGTAHLLLADQVVRPVLESKSGEVLLWRVHRRAKRDESGNQFSVLLFGEPNRVAHILKRIQEHPLVQRMQRQGLIVGIREELGRSGELSAMSDPSWPKELQLAWPSFAMGASQVWLELLNQHTGDSRPSQAEELEELLRYYEGVEDKLTENWREFGKHAFLHHLSAIFGYEKLPGIGEL